MRDSSKGQTLVEVLLAVGVASIVLIALTRAVTIGLRNAQFAKNQALATEYAQETMERLRVYRDQSGWQEFSQEGNCENPPGLSSPPPPFTRTIDCSLNSDKVEVKVTVSWDSHKAELTSYLTKWH